MAVLKITRVTLIANPASRRADRVLGLATRAFSTRGITCTVALTERGGHAADLARAAEGDAVFVLGGDGTAMEVIGALAGTETPIGIVPGGTGNLIARSLGIPRRADLAIRALLTGRRLRTDLGILGDGRYFAFAAGVGIDAEMVEHTSAIWKRRLGVMAYVLTASRAAMRRDRFRVRATIDGEVHERDAVAVMIANFGAVLDDWITLGPDISYDDGQLDVCIFSPNTIVDATRVFYRMLRRDFRNDPCMWYGTGRSIRIETDPPRAAQADGEMIGSTPLEITVAPRAATLLIPRR